MKSNKNLIAACFCLILIIAFSDCSSTSPRHHHHKNLEIVSQFRDNQLGDAIDQADITLLYEVPEFKIIIDQNVKTEAQKASLNEFVRDMMAKVKLRDPDFYASFQQQIRSNDQEARSEALEAGMDAITSQIEDYYGSDQINWDELFNKIFKDY